MPAVPHCLVAEPGAQPWSLWLPCPRPALVAWLQKADGLHSAVFAPTSEENHTEELTGACPCTPVSLTPTPPSAPENHMEELTGVCLWAPEQHEGCKGFSEPLTLTLSRRCPLSQILLVPVTLKKSKQTHKEPERSLCRRGRLWREAGTPACSKVKPGAYWMLAGAAQAQGTLGLNCSLHTPAGPKSSLTSSGILGHLQCMRIHKNMHAWMHASIHTHTEA